MPLPTVQPPARDAPTPIMMPPQIARVAVCASGTRTRNSPADLAAINAPTNRPMTNRVPQFMRAESPVALQRTMSAVGVVMPRPPLRPALAESTKPTVPMMPTSTATMFMFSGLAYHG